jgi:hypothetical protein
MRNTAIVVSQDSTLEQIERYLPSNYEAREVTLIVIEGTDNAGWTMEDYVIPRLASGLHFATRTDIYLRRPIGACDNGRTP